MEVFAVGPYATKGQQDAAIPGHQNVIDQVLAVAVEGHLVGGHFVERVRAFALELVPFRLSFLVDTRDLFGQGAAGEGGDIKLNIARGQFHPGRSTFLSKP